MIRRSVWKQVLSQIRPGKTGKRFSSAADAAHHAASRDGSVGAADPPQRNDSRPGMRARDTDAYDLTSYYKSISHNEKQRLSQERDFMVSVLSSSPTKRDAKKYLQTFGGSAARLTPQSIRSVSESPQFVQESAERKTGRTGRTADDTSDQPHVAIVKLQDPDTLDDATLGALAKTFVQLRALGLYSVLVIGLTAAERRGPHGWLDYVTHETLRVAAAIDRYSGEPATSLVDASVSLAADGGSRGSSAIGPSPFLPGRIFISQTDSLMRPLRNGNIAVVPPYAFSAEQSVASQVPADDIVLALTKFFAGIQRRESGSSNAEAEDAEDAESKRPLAAAVVDRVIVIDPLGGTPSERRSRGAHVFLNLEEEYQQVKGELQRMTHAPAPQPSRRPSTAHSLTLTAEEIVSRHQSNLDIAKHALAWLPSSASVLLTTPAEAANLVSPEREPATDADSIFGYVGSVGTRRSQNPLIHNLLTDRPVYSSSLPLGRISRNRCGGGGGAGSVQSLETREQPRLAQTTLAKRGMPLTVFPDPRTSPWTPPAPGAPRLRLTDTCIDLPRLVHLINDSFNRTLDVDDYLRRVENSLAGVIIAGEYEGGAILTWERPPGVDEETAYRTGRLVPYLDKFAVLKKSQGAGGVADIVFTSMVRTCLPYGVCWRSRKDNPVNRWYFERSSGSWKLEGINWTMFWTTPWEVMGAKGLWDYAAVCRSIEPSWADNKQILD